MKDNDSRHIDIFIYALCLLFVALKLIGYIDWSWIWVLSPLWIPLTFGIVVFIFVGIKAIIRASKEYNKSKNWMSDEKNEELLHQMWTGERDDEV